MPAARNGGSHKCASCSHPEQEQLNADLVAGIALAKLSAKYHISPESLRQHRKNHLNPGVKAIKAARDSVKAAKTGDKSTVLARLIDMEPTYDEIIRVAEGERDANGNYHTMPNLGIQLAAMRDLQALRKLIAQMTGELDDRPQTIINVLTTDAWLQARRAMMTALEPFPEARLAVANRLMLLESNPR